MGSTSGIILEFLGNFISAQFAIIKKCWKVFHFAVLLTSISKMSKDASFAQAKSFLRTSIRSAANKISISIKKLKLA